MLRILRHALTSRVATNSYPASVIEPPDGFRGKPVVDFARCSACGSCAQACPTSAISVQTKTHGAAQSILTIDYGKCIFCGECETACPDAIHLSTEFQLAAKEKTHLVTRAIYKADKDGALQFVEAAGTTSPANASMEEIGDALKGRIHDVLGRSLHIREVDAGSCNGCEVEISALTNPVYDLERFGMHFVASPRHADMLLVTGPVTRNMEIALKETYEATPHPKLIVAVGACAISGGMFGQSYASRGGVDNVLPVDVYIPGCPPRPEALLHGILLALDRWTEQANG